MCRHSSQTARVQSGRVLAWFRTYEQGFLLLYMKQIASPGSMHNIGCLGLVHLDDPEGWDGEGGGGVFRMGSTCTPMVESCQCMAKPIQYCKVKKKKKKKQKNQ